MNNASEFMTSVPDIKKYIMGGKAEFTLQSNKTGKHHTYRVKQWNSHPDPDVRFVYYLSGANNESDGDWDYLGMVKSEQSPSYPGTQHLYFYQTDKSPTVQSNTFQALQWFVIMLRKNQYDISEDVSFMHSGICSACGRKLTDPESIKTGLGPVCREKL